MIDFFETLSAKIRFQKPAFWTVKVAFLSVGIMLLKLAVSYSVNVLSTLSRLWISFNSCLIPPHNLIAVIFTIIAIKVSSSLHPKPSEMSTATKEVFRESENFSRQQKSRDLDSKDSSFNRPRTSPEARPGVDELSPDFIVKFLFSVEKSVESSPCLTGSEEKENPNPPVSAGFPVIQSTDTHRKTVRSTSPAPSQKLSKPNTVAKPEKQNDTLDSRGKAISDGRGKILRGHLEKRKTWDVPPRVSVIEPEQKPSSSSAASNRRKLLRKSETFNVRASSSGGDGGGSGLRRGKSLSHDESSASSSGGVGVGGGGGGLGMSKDELYWQSEEFIKKFRQQMTEERFN